MNTFLKIIKIAYGLMWLVFGFNHFAHFLPMEMPAGAMGEYMAALISAGFIMPVIGAFMILAGFAFLADKFVALMLVVLAPIVVNILLTHLLLAPATAGMSVVIMAIQIFLMVQYISAYKPMLMPCSGGACTSKGK